MYLLHGYLGYGNYGDELLASLVEQRIHKLEPNAQIARLSSRNSLIEHFKLISQCRELICIGGLFQDKSSDRSPIYYCATVLLAKLLGKKVKILAQGIGPLSRTKSQFCTWLAYRLANKVSVRDLSSKSILDSWGIKHYYGSDLAWLLVDSEARPSAEAKAKIENVFFNVSPGERMLVISLRSEAGDFSGKLSERIVDKIAREFCIEADTPLMILQMQDQDRKVHDRFYNYTKKIYLVEAKYFKPEEIIYILKNYGREIVGMRFHGLIFAKIAGLEITAIASDPKIREFTQQIESYDCGTLKARAEQHYKQVLC